MIEPRFTKFGLDGYMVSSDCFCGNTSTAYVTAPEVFAWRQGAFVQDAFPSLSADQREALFISGTCSACYENLYSHECYYTETPDGYGCPTCIYG